MTEMTEFREVVCCVTSFPREDAGLHEEAEVGGYQLQNIEVNFVTVLSLLTDPLLHYSCQPVLPWKS